MMAIGRCALGRARVTSFANRGTCGLPALVSVSGRRLQTPTNVVLYLLWESQEELLEGEAHATSWETRLPTDRGRFTIDVVATTLERLSARTYVDSGPLDLDHLTVSQPSKAA